MIEVDVNKNKKEKAILFGLVRRDQSVQKAQEHLDELAFLTQTSGASIVDRFIQKLDKPDGRTFMGKGKLQEVKSSIKETEADLLIFDDDLSPSQVRNLEKELDCKVVDRSLLILDIFSLRAQTSQAKTQVELAQYQYLLPRLTNMWTHLSKQKGGIGMKGPGETELETDRRIVRDKISLLKGKLTKIEKQSITQRRGRKRMVKVALVGYTNAGKSSLMSLLSKAEAFAENKLFATVDSLVRKVVINDVPFLLSDTVGFIRKLPHSLVECFKSTLDEVREADILVHLVDVSHPNYHEQIEVVDATLAEIGADNKPTILVFNKIDLINGTRSDNGQDEMDIDQLRMSYRKNGHSNTAFISVTRKSNIDELREIVYNQVTKKHFQIFPNYLRPQVY